MNSLAHLHGPPDQASKLRQLVAADALSDARCPMDVAMVAMRRAASLTDHLPADVAEPARRAVAAWREASDARLRLERQARGIEEVNAAPLAAGTTDCACSALPVRGRQ